jgi:hypothetical protein
MGTASRSPTKAASSAESSWSWASRRWGAVTAAIASRLINPRTFGTDDRIRELEAEIARLSAQLEAAGATAPHR